VFCSAVQCIAGRRGYLFCRFLLRRRYILPSAKNIPSVRAVYKQHAQKVYSLPNIPSVQKVYSFLKSQRRLFCMVNLGASWLVRIDRNLLVELHGRNMNVKTLPHSANTATYCDKLQCTAPHCNTRHTASHCSNVSHCDTMQYSATHCDTLRHAATHCDTLRHTATHCDTLRHTASHCHTPAH